MHNKKYQFISTATLLATFPMQLLAAAPTTFRSMAALFVRAINGLVVIIFASLVVGMIYGVILYILNADNEKSRMEIKGYLFWGVIGLVVLLGLWGILALLSSSMGWGSVGIVFISPPV